MKRRGSGQQKIMSLIQFPLLNGKVKTSLMNKKFIIVTKIVDNLIENLLYKMDGFDLYENGANIGMSNMLYICIPFFCGKESFDRLLELFVNMMRERSDENIDVFYFYIEKMIDECDHEDFKGDLSMILATRDVIGEVIDQVPVDDLDPAIPSFVAHCSHWGDDLGELFTVLHDNSKPISQNERALRLFMEQRLEPVTSGYGDRQSKLPLKATDIVFCDSRDHFDVQIADIFASATAYWAGKFMGKEVDEYFWGQLNDSSIPHIIVNSVWPTSDVTPETVGENMGAGCSPANATAQFLHDSEKLQGTKN